MDTEQAVDYLVSRLPEFAAVVNEHRREYDELLIHVLMGDLARFYMERGVTSSDVARRLWEAVEEMAATGDQAVENAVWVSLIEWFAHGDDTEKAALVDAGPLQGPKTMAIRAYYLLPDKGGTKSSG